MQQAEISAQHVGILSYFVSLASIHGDDRRAVRLADGGTCHRYSQWSLNSWSFTPYTPTGLSVRAGLDSTGPAFTHPPSSAHILDATQHLPVIWPFPPRCTQAPSEASGIRDRYSGTTIISLAI